MRNILILLCVFALCACTQSKSGKSIARNEDPNLIKASISYRERIMIPSPVLVELELVGLNSKGEINAIFDSVQVEATQMPYELELNISPVTAEKIDTKTVALVARIYSNEELWFESKAVEVSHPFSSMTQNIIASRFIQSKMSVPSDIANAAYVFKKVAGKDIVEHKNLDVPHLFFRTQKSNESESHRLSGRISGNDGCNNFGGEYTIEGEFIRSSNMYGTMRLCGEGIEQSTMINQSIAQATSWRKYGDTLELRQGTRSLAVLEKHPSEVEKEKVEQEVIENSKVEELESDEKPAQEPEQIIKVAPIKGAKSETATSSNENAEEKTLETNDEAESEKKVEDKGTDKKDEKIETKGKARKPYWWEK